MGSTKIINVLKDDRFEELLEIAKQADASEVIFVLPKKTKAFRSEEQFALFSKEIKSSGKYVSFLCSNPETNVLAKKYNFDVLSVKTEKTETPQRESIKIKPAVVATAVKNWGLNVDDDEDMDKESDHSGAGREGDPKEEHDDFEEDEEALSEIPEKPEEDENEESYKEEEESEETEDKAPFGTRVDDDGNIIYDEEDTAEEASFPDGDNEFKIITAASKTRGMEDVIRPKFGKSIKITQKDRRPVKLETKVGQSGLDWNNERSENIWSGISKPAMPGFSIFNKFRSFKNHSFKKNFPKVSYKNPQRRWIGILFLASLFALAFIVFLVTGSAKIEIKPRAEKLNLQLKVSISPNFSSVDTSFNRLPGQLFAINKSMADEFNSTAEKDAVQKSRGTLTIYNEYSTSPQPLVATTRFELIQDDKESGLVFRTLKSVIVPGMKVENGVVTPGKISIEVIADKAGQTYNIPASSFGIMAWREKGDTARYEKIYGKSSGPMHGGILGKAKVVSEFDYNNAKDQLTVKIKNEIRESLKSQSDGLELLAGIESSIDSIESSAGIDDAADTFTMTIKSSIVTVGYKKEDLIDLITQYVDKANNLMVVPAKLELSYKNAVINPANKTLEFTVNIGGNAYAKLDKEDVIGNLTGKNKNQIKDYLGSIENIDSAKIILSPFWVKKIPKNPAKIDILLTF